MNIEVCEVLANVEYVDELTKKKVVTKEFIPINPRGMDVIENVDINNEITAFSEETRIIGLGKQMYKLTLASYKALKKELTKKGIIWRFNYAHRSNA